MLEKKFIEVICVTYGHNNELKCFINSFKCQDDQDYFLRIIHDGNCKQYKKLKKDLESNDYLTQDITLECSNKRFNDYGHSLRDYCLKNPIRDSEFTLQTNGDNYYLPIFVRRIKKVYKKYESIPLLIFFNFVHRHKVDKLDKVGFFREINANLKETKIDMGSCVIKSDIARKIGFNSRRHNADWDYFKECADYIMNLNLDEENLFVKQDEILFAHC